MSSIGEDTQVRVVPPRRSVGRANAAAGSWTAGLGRDVLRHSVSGLFSLRLGYLPAIVAGAGSVS